jgi:UDP:flavonoid glycosyltransferase YjiC (YdhE family)
VFVYVSARYWAFDRLIEQLAGSKHRTLVYARDLDAQRAASLTTQTLGFAPDIVDIDEAARRSALVVSHGGHGTTSRVLLGGRPLLVLPEHTEQALVGHRLSTQGLGIDIGLRRNVQHDFAALVHRLLTDRSYTAAAEHFAARHRDHDQRDTLAELALRCEELAG